MDTMLGWWSGFDAESRTEEAYFEKYETTASCHRIQEDLEEQMYIIRHYHRKLSINIILIVSALQ